MSGVKLEHKAWAVDFCAFVRSRPIFSSESPSDSGNEKE